MVLRLDSEEPRPAAVQPVPLCEGLLGLIGHHQLTPADAASCGGGGGGPQVVTVAALVPRGPLIRNPLVHIGESSELLATVEFSRIVALVFG